MTPALRAATLLSASALVGLLLAEVALRTLPLMDLDEVEFSSRRSETLHHDERPLTLTEYGTCLPGRDPITILALGDSWMTVYDGAMIEAFATQLLAQAAASGCLRVCNGGATSYAPSLYLLKGRVAARRCDPDLIVVNVDATDIGDEWHRYRIPQVRDPKSGRLLAVPFSHDAHDMAFWHGLEAAQSGPSYVWRAVKKVYHLYVFMPQLRRLIHNGPWDAALLMDIHLARQYSPEQLRELAHFRLAVTEMMEGLGELVGDPARTIVTYHPHYLGAAADSGANRYSDVLSRLLQETARETRVTLVDGTGKMALVHGADFGLAFQWPDDPFSHLTEQGYREYGVYVARAVEPLVSTIASHPAGARPIP